MGQSFRKQFSLMQHCLVFRKKEHVFQNNPKGCLRNVFQAEDLDSYREMRFQVTGTAIFLNYSSFSVGIFQVLRICLLDDK